MVDSPVEDYPGTGMHVSTLYRIAKNITRRGESYSQCDLEIHGILSHFLHSSIPFTCTVYQAEIDESGPMKIKEYS